MFRMIIVNITLDSKIIWTLYAIHVGVYVARKKNDKQDIWESSSLQEEVEIKTLFFSLQSYSSEISKLDHPFLYK